MPVFFDTVYFSDQEGTTVEANSNYVGLREISDTQIRELLGRERKRAHVVHARRVA